MALTTASYSFDSGLYICKVTGSFWKIQLKRTGTVKMEAGALINGELKFFGAYQRFRWVDDDEALFEGLVLSKRDGKYYFNTGAGSGSCEKKN